MTLTFGLSPEHISANFMCGCILVTVVNYSVLFWGHCDLDPAFGLLKSCV